MTGAAARIDRRRADRRVARVAIHYPERRSGFDRRTAGATAWGRMVLAYRARPALAAAAALAILALSAADLLLTHRLLAAGAVEANPVMAAVLGRGLLPAAIVKAAVTIPVAGAVWWMRRYRRILEFSVATAALLAALVAYEAVGLAMVG
ncbi:MAG: hypothetical protein KQH83_01370 [Actinobacteria bacterium]|nr:hypothetical protein [Actinomycetota bacterium]